MKINPVEERAVIKPIQEEERKVGSLYIPDTVNKERPQIGEVIAVSDDLEIAKVGDKVVYAKYGGTEIKIDDEEYLIVARGDILAVITE